MMNTGRSWGQRGGRGGRSWNGRSSNHTPTNNNRNSDGRPMNRSSGRSSNRRNFSNSNSRSESRSYGPSIENIDSIEEIGTRASNSISIAIEGCCHGQLTAIYERLRKYEEDETDTIDGTASSKNDASKADHQPKKKKIDLLICCGDFQSIRTPADFHSLAVPAKYREMGTFHKYYNEEWVAPILTVFCGGNHEASQPLSELYYGGWVAPRMYYLGAAGVVRFRGLRIGGLSGIYKSHDHYQSRNEIPPYDQKQVRSVYHYRNVDVYRLSCLRTDPAVSARRSIEQGHTPSNEEASQQLQEVRSTRRLDVMVSHDWPQGIEQYGDVDDLVRRKPFFRQEISENALGSPPAAHLLHTLQPRYWFAAHLHVKFHAKVVHQSTTASRDPQNKPSYVKGLIPTQVFQTKLRSSSGDANESTDQSLYQPEYRYSVATTNEKHDGDTDPTLTAARPSTTQFLAPESSSCQNAVPDLTELMTQFLSLDKCLPRRQYLSILHVPDTCTHDGKNDADVDSKLEYDLEWLAIIRKTHQLAASSHPHRIQLPQMIQSSGGMTNPHQVTAADIAWVKERIGDDLTIPENFTPTLPQKYNEQTHLQLQPPPLPRMGNPQTDSFLNMLQLKHLPNLTIPYREEGDQQTSCSAVLVTATEPARTLSLELSYGDENEIDLDGDTNETFNAVALPSDIISNDENEIDVDDVAPSAVMHADDTLHQHDMKKPRID